MRCFVLGNGPSLKNTNLDLLQGEIVFGCNNIHLAYGFTKMRVTHYIRAEEADTDINLNNWQESIDVHKELGCQMYVNHVFENADGTRIHEIRTCTHYRKHFDNPDAPHLWHLPTLCTFGTSVNVAVQIAVQLGYGPIYLVGCDLGYNAGVSHFDDNYKTGNEQSPIYANGDALAAHIIAARSSPVKIYNATIGGNLEVYERVQYESLF